MADIDPSVSAADARDMSARQAGYSWDEINQWKAQKTEEARQAGYSDQEINSYFGQTDPKSVEDRAAAFATKNTIASPPSFDPEKTSPLEAFRYGLESSSTGYLSRGQNPEAIEPQHAPFASHIAYQAGVIGGDIPAMIVGALGGGVTAGALASETGPGAIPAAAVGAGAGGAALPEEIKSQYVDALTNGQVKGPWDFLKRQAAVQWNTAKQAAIGTLTTFVGGKAGVTAVKVGANAIGQFAAKSSAELATVTTAGAAVAGRLPTREDAIDGTIFLLALHGAGKVADATVSTIKGNLVREAVDKGETAVQTAQRAAADPVLRSKLMAEPEPKVGTDPVVTPSTSPAGDFVMAKTNNVMTQFNADVRAQAQSIAAMDLAAVDQQIGQKGRFERVAQEPGQDTAVSPGRFDTSEDQALKDETIPVDSSRTIPYGAGISSDGRVIYYDRRLPTQLEVKRTDGTTGFMDPRRYIEVHERKEWESLEKGKNYTDAHEEDGNPHERAAVEGDGWDWNDYNDKILGAIRRITENGPHDDIPNDLLRKPYEESGETHLLNNQDPIGSAGPEWRQIQVMEDERGAQARDLEGGAARAQAGAGGGGPPAGGAGKPPTGAEPIRSGPPGAPRSQEQLPPPRPRWSDDPWGAMKSRMADVREGPAVWDRVKQGVYRLYLELFDPAHPLRKLVDMVEKAGIELPGKEGRTVPELPENANPRWFHRLAEASDVTDGRYQIDRGSFNMDGERTGDGLGQIIDDFKGKDRDDFWSYAIARWAVEKAEQGKETGVEIDAARQVVGKGVELNDQFERGFQKLQAWQNGLLGWLRDGGVLSKESFDRITAADKARIPGFRVADENEPEPQAANVPGRGKTVFNSVKDFLGSDKKISNVMESLVKEAFLRTRLARRNIANLKTVDLAEKLGVATKTGEYADTALTPKDMDDLANDMMNDRSTGKSAVWQRFGGKLKDNELVVFRDGKPERWQFEDEHLAHYLRGLDEVSSNTLVRALSLVTKPTRALNTILNPLFAPTVAMFDVPFQAVTKPGWGAVRDAAFQLYKGLGPAFSNARGNLGQDNPIYDKWLRSGGAERAFGSETTKQYAQRILGAQEDPAFGQRAWNTIKTPLQGLKAWSQAWAEAPRVGRFALEQERGTSDLRSAVASTEAGFHRAGFGGPVAKQINAAVPFFTAVLNGMEQTIRGQFGIGKTITGEAFDAKSFTIKAAALVTLPFVASWAAYHDEEWYKAAPRWQKDNSIPIPVGGGRVYWQRMPPILAQLYGGTPVRLMEKFVDENPQALKGIGQSIGDSFTPPGATGPTVMLPIVEHMANWSFFRGQPLVSQDVVNNVGTAEQFTPYSTAAARGLSRFFSDVPILQNMKLSPPVMDNYIRQWGGTMGMAAIRTAENVLQETGTLKPNAAPPDWGSLPGLASHLSRYPSANNQPVLDFEGMMDKINQTHGSLKKLIDAGDTDRFAQIANENPTAAALHTMKLRADPAAQMLSGEQKRSFGDILSTAEQGADKDAAVQIHNADKALQNARKVVQMINAAPTSKYSPTDKQQMLDMAYSNMQVIAERGLWWMQRAHIQ